MKFEAIKKNSSSYPNIDTFNKKIKKIGKWSLTSVMIYSFTLNTSFGVTIPSYAGGLSYPNPVYPFFAFSSGILFLLSFAVPVYSILSLLHYKKKMKSDDESKGDSKGKYSEEQYKKLKKKYITFSFITILLFIIIFILTSYFIPPYIS